jgi:hypothetical protein
MCEPLSAFSKAYVDWRSDVDRFRLSSISEDYRQMHRMRLRGREPPSQAEEAWAFALLTPVDDLIRERFGIDPVVSRAMLCSDAMLSGRPIELLAGELVRKLRTLEGPASG